MPNRPPFFVFYLSGAAAPPVQIAVEATSLAAATVIASSFARSLGLEASEPRLAVPAFAAPSAIGEALSDWKKHRTPDAGDRLANLLNEILFAFLTPGGPSDDGSADIRVLQAISKRTWSDRERVALQRGARALQRELDADVAMAEADRL